MIDFIKLVMEIRIGVIRIRRIRNMEVIEMFIAFIKCFEFLDSKANGF